jgi:hypothetical protein
MKKKMVGMELPTVLGMGISGPVLAFLTATLFSAFKGVFGWGDGVYAMIMLLLSGALATFPVMASEYVVWQKIIAWPIASVMIFVSAWGSSTGMSAGEDALVEKHAEQRVYLAMIEEPGEAACLAVSSPFSAINAEIYSPFDGEYVYVITNGDASISDHVVMRAHANEWTNLALGMVFDAEGIGSGATGRVIIIEEDADTVNQTLTNREMFFSAETDPVFTVWAKTNDIDYSEVEIPMSSESGVRGGFFKRLR